MNIYDGKISERIRECAKIVGSGNELSRITGIPRRTLEDYMKSSTEPKATNLIAIAEVAGVTLDWLMTGEGESSKLARSTGLDMKALEAAISLVEEVVQLEKSNPTPQKKAMVTAIIYEEIADSPEKELDMPKIVKLVRLVG